MLKTALDWIFKHNNNNVMLTLGLRKVKQEATALQIFHFTKHHSVKNTEIVHCMFKITETLQGEILFTVSLH